MNTSPEHTFKDLIRSELVKRMKKNPRYSLRAFASSLGIHHGILSLILNDKRPVTAKHIMTLGKALDLSPRQVDKFIKSLEGPEKISASKRKIQQMNRLTLDVFHVVSEWYYDAIMELARVKGFQPSAHYLSKSLGLSIGQAHDAIERLKRVGLLELNPDGSWKEFGDFSTIQHIDFTDAALRAYQKKILDLSADAVTAVPKALRDHTSLTVAIRKNDLDPMKLMLKKYRRELLAFAQRPSEDLYDAVYSFSFSMFPLTKK